MPPLGLAYEVVLTDANGQVVARTCRHSSESAAQTSADILNFRPDRRGYRWSVAVIEERFVRV